MRINNVYHIVSARVVQEQTLQDVMQEALQKHATGVKYREINAGSKIDKHMQDQGKHNTLLKQLFYLT